VLAEVTLPGYGPCTLLEVGAGAGNTAFPIIANNQNPNLKIHACDFSKIAVDVMRENDAYDTRHIQADVWDASGLEFPPGLAEGSVDVVLMIFIFSALSPSQWRQAVSNIYRVLKPGGEVLFRDYGRGDLAQVRFKKGRYMEENFYVRGDGTRVYFFEKDELAHIWTSGGAASSGSDTPRTTGFEVISLGVDRRLLVNRAKQLKMYRCWMQGRFRKAASSISGSAIAS
jgi:tRNAThr (cytosine32-N3)-methyltransferase